MEKIMNNDTLAKKNIKIKADKKIFLRLLNLNDVSKSYIKWLNDYEVTKFTEQRYFKHTLESTMNFVSQKFDSKKCINFWTIFV